MVTSTTLKTRQYLLVYTLALLIISACSNDSNQRRFNYKIVGEGKPAIILCVAMGETLESWDSLQNVLGQLTKVVSYDRLGLGKSDTTTASRTLENLSEELHEFVAISKIDGPYVLVGHSLGSSIVRKYQNDYPEDVLGMLLIDPVHEDQFEQLMAVKSQEDRESTLMDREEFLSTLAPGELNEAVQYHQQRRAMKETRYPADIPVTILGSFQIGHGATEEDREIKRKLYEQWLSQAPQIRLVATTNSGHYIQDTEPQLVIDEVKLMLEGLGD